jgi:long-chain acyl-CoA synthetase
MKAIQSPLNYLLKAVKEYPEKNCIETDGQQLTYQEFYESLSQLESYFASKGVTRSQKVALYISDDLLMLKAIFSLWELGAIAVPMNIKYTLDRFREIENKIQPDIGFFSTSINTGVPIGFNSHELFFLPNTPQLKDSLKITPKEDDLALIMFTSGSTGVPKGVPITHSALFCNTSLTANLLQITQSDKILINTPLYTTSSLIHVLTMFSKGAAVVIATGFMFGSTILSQIILSGCTGFGGVPVHFLRLTANDDNNSGIGKLRFFMNSGEHLPIPTIRKLRLNFPGVKLFCVYGLTEVAGRLCILEDAFLDKKLGSVGKPLMGMRVTIRGEDGTELSHGLTGQVYVAGPYLTKGYINNEIANKAEFTSLGFATGDYGHLDQEGFLFLSGRKDDMIKVGGEKVSIKMVEEVLYNFNDFSEFYVYSTFDNHMGCVPALRYVLKAGRTFDKAKYLKFLSSTLPSTHIPVKLEEVISIPRTDSGKIIRKTN